jgi:hypothetical protein
MSKRAVVFACIVLILGMVSGPAAFAGTIIPAVQSCRTEIPNADTNRHDTSKLSVRSDDKSAKSWIKFDLGDLDVSSLETATLTLTLHEGKTGDRNFDVSCVNDDCRDNIGWDERSLTWNNAPGNAITDLAGLDPGKTTLVATVNFTDGVPGQSFTIDIRDALETDTDGIVQFVLHNSNSLLNFATHDHAEEAWRPFIEVTEGTKSKAKKPSPADGATDVCLTPILSWTAGAYAAGSSPMHKVFFSEDFDDVNDGVGGVTQDAAECAAPGSPLDFGTTYYWRVDEANSVSGWDRGDVWSFTTEPANYALPGALITAAASSVSNSTVNPNNTCNGVGLNADDLHSQNPEEMWLSAESEPNAAWISYTFDQTYKLTQMLVWNYNQATEDILGLGIKEALIEYSVDGTNWTSWGTTEFTRATVAQITTVDLQNVAAQRVRITALSNWGGLANMYGLSEVRFLYIPTQAREFSPAQGSTNVDPAVTMSWRAGREAVTHNLYLGTDSADLPLVEVVSGSPYATYDASALDLQLGQTYYWRVDEVNEAQVPATWQGDTLSFSTREFLVVDDFERYNNDAEAYRRVFQTWIDSLGYTIPVEVAGNGTGAYIGYDPAAGDIMEKGIVHGGAQSAPISYGNDGKNISEVKRTFDEVQDWTQAGVKTLSIAFYGEPTNTGQLYVKINNTRVDYDLGATDIAAAEWKVWKIDLSTVNTDLQNVLTMTIGTQGGSGMIYVDDICLYP